MKIVRPLGCRLCMLSVVGLLAAWSLLAIAIPPFPDTIGYSPGMWLPAVFADGCSHESLPDKSAIYLNAQGPIGDLPFWGYPMRGALFTGLNDTLQLLFSIENDMGHTYKVGQHDYGAWYEPRVLAMDAAGPDAPPFRSAAQLGFRFRGWYEWDLNIVRSQAPDSFKDGGTLFRMIFDVWNLPEGRFQLCITPTDSVPSDFVAVGGGWVYDYYQAQSLADSTNAYEACFWRALSDSDFTGAQNWVNKILQINPKSVPGWWIQYVNAEAELKADEAKAALDSALLFLNSSADPALPDSTRRALNSFEANYLEYCHQFLNYYRSLYGK